MAVKLGNGKWAVKENNLLAYNDNSGQFFNKEFDFTRGSSATYVGKDGLIKTAGLQDTNLVQNGDFSNWTNDNPDNYNVLNENANNYVTESNGQLRMVSDNSATIAIRPEPNTMLTVGKIYKVSVDLTFTTGTLDISGIQFNTSGTKVFYLTAPATYLQIAKASVLDVLIDNVSVKQGDPNDEWALGSGLSYGDGKAINDGTINQSLLQTNVFTIGKSYKINFTISDVVGSLDARIWMATGGARIEANANGNYTTYWEADGTDLYTTTLSTNTATYSISNISVQEIQVNTPRIDFSDSADGALLLEPQSTNLITYSEDFSDSSWTLFGSIQANSSVSPNGLTTATKLTHTHSQYNMLRVVAGGVRTTSVFVKNVDADNFYIRKSGGGYAYYNFDTKTVNDNSLKVEYFSNDWIRLSLSTDETALRQFGIGQSETDLSEVGNSVYVWGAQVEESSYPTSYIPTQGSASTRIAETCNNSGSAQDFNSEEGVLYAEIAALSNTADASKFISISDGTYNNRASILFSNGSTNQIRTFLRVGGVVQIDVYNNVTDVANFNKVAFSYKENDFKVYINGSLVSSDTSGSVWSANTITKLSFSEINTSANKFEGKVKGTRLYNTALTDQELIALTTI